MRSLISDDCDKREANVRLVLNRGTGDSGWYSPWRRRICARPGTTVVAAESAALSAAIHNVSRHASVRSRVASNHTIPH
jgi:hypothetical protein